MSKCRPVYNIIRNILTVELWEFEYCSVSIKDTIYKMKYKINAAIPSTRKKNSRKNRFHKTVKCMKNKIIHYIYLVAVVFYLYTLITMTCTTLHLM